LVFLVAVIGVAQHLPPESTLPGGNNHDPRQPTQFAASAQKQATSTCQTPFALPALTAGKRTVKFFPPTVT